MLVTWKATSNVSAPAAPSTFGSVTDPETVLRQAPHENFVVASLLLPRRVRAELLAIYGFARLTDDLGDKVAGDRLAHLDWLDAEVRRAAMGQASHPLLQALTPLFRDHCLSTEPFSDLIEANRRDQLVHRYGSLDELIDYCRYSAVPVGRLVLQVFGMATPQRVAQSDAVCTGLQIVEHLQDIKEDAEVGRIYLPADDMARCGVEPCELRAPSASHCLRRLVALEASRARRMLEPAVPLAASLPWRPRVAVSGFAAGGHAALDAVVGAGYDVLGVRCRPRRRRLATRMLSGLVATGAPEARS
jgi:squalene synthase HpnC